MRKHLYAKYINKDTNWRILQRTLVLFFTFTWTMTLFSEYTLFQVLPRFKFGGKFGSLALGDIDNNGILDLATSGNSAGSSRFTIAKNDGNGFFSLFQEPLGVDAGLTTTATVFGNIDTDSDLELIVSGSGRLFAFENDGTGIFTIDSEPMGAGEGLTRGSLALGDIDGDSDLDLVASGFDLNTFTSRLIVFKNDGQGTFFQTEEPMGVNDGVTRGSITLGDVDNNGTLDLVVSGFDTTRTRRLIVFKNNGTGTFVQDSEPLGPNKGVFCAYVALGNIDKDADLELAVMGGDVTRRLIIFENDGNGNFTVDSEPLGLGKGVFEGALAFGDIDDDGTLDLAVTGNGETGLSTLKIFLNDGKGNFSLFQEPMGLLEGLSSGGLALGDLDQDSDLDLVINGENRFRASARQVLVFKFEKVKDPDVTISKYAQGAVLGFQFTYTIAAYNLGEQAATLVTIKDNIPSGLQIDNVSSPGVAVGNIVTWDIGTLPGQSSVFHQVTVTIPATGPDAFQLGDLLINNAEIKTTSTKDNPDNNTVQFVSTVIGSWDPNEKAVTPKGFIETNEILTYYIHFENEGTAPAINISITDVLDGNLDETSLAFISDGGTFDANTRTITWSFTNINLPPEGEGLVSFRIRLTPGLTVGTEIVDSASIFFDFNPPIDTAPITNIIGTPEELALQDLIIDMLILANDIKEENIAIERSFLEILNAAIDNVIKGFDLLQQGNTTLAKNLFNKAVFELDALLLLISSQEGRLLSQATADDWRPRIEDFIARIQEIINPSSITSTSSSESNGEEEDIDLSSQGGATVIMNNVMNPMQGDLVTTAYGLSETENVSIKVYNVKGELVKVLVDETGSAGRYTVEWDGRDESGNTVSSGLYLVRVLIGTEVKETKKVIIIK